jgi:hypothetical protein
VEATDPADPVVIYAFTTTRESAMNLLEWVRNSFICAALLAIAGGTPQAETKGEPPAKINTRIGTLEYQAGFPTKATVETLYNEMDFQRAVLAYQYADILVSLYSINAAYKAAGTHEGDLVLFQRFCDPKTIALTCNDTTIYGLSFLDLDKGPMVVEVQPGNVYGAFFDLWQVTIGPIAEAGGTFVLASENFEGTVPAGATLIKSRTKLALAFVRGLVVNNDVEAAARSLETVKVYPLSQIASRAFARLHRCCGRVQRRARPRHCRDLLDEDARRLERNQHPQTQPPPRSGGTPGDPRRPAVSGLC